MKNWKVLIFFGSVWLLSFAGFAQQQIIKQAQYEMLKNSLEYLATDSVSQELNANPVCNDCLDFEQNKKYAQGNVKQGIIFVNENNPENVPNVLLEDLNSYKVRLINRLTTGSKYRISRLQTPQFNQLKLSLNQIENNAKEKLGSPKTNPVASQAAGNQVINVSGVHSTPLDSAKVAKIVKDVVKSERWLSDYLPYLLSLLNLCLVGYLLYKSTKRQSKNEDGLVKDLHKRINIAEEDIKSTQLNVQPLTDRVYKLETNIENLRRQVNNQNNNGDKPRAERDFATPVQSGGGFYVQPDPTPTTALRDPEKCKYALYADLGDGFSVSSLSNQISADSLFEIKITSPTAAKLSITQNESAQKMAFSDPYQYLRTTCTYSGDPGGRIRTNTPGELELVGNKWRIVTKAEISFYR